MRQLSVTSVGASIDVSFMEFSWSEALGVHANCSIRLQASGAVLKMENGGTWLSPPHQPFEDKGVGLCSGDRTTWWHSSRQTPVFLEEQIPGFREAGLCVSCWGTAGLQCVPGGGICPTLCTWGGLLRLAASVSKCSVAGSRTGRWGHLCTCAIGCSTLWPHLPWHHPSAAQASAIFPEAVCAIGSAEKSDSFVSRASLTNGAAEWDEDALRCPSSCPFADCPGLQSKLDECRRDPGRRQLLGSRECFQPVCVPEGQVGWQEGSCSNTWQEGWGVCWAGKWTEGCPALRWDSGELPCAPCTD